MLANIMLNELNKELDFVRYADDLIIMAGSRQAADRVMKSVTRSIEEKLGLKVNAKKSKVDKPNRIMREILADITENRQCTVRICDTGNDPYFNF